MLKVFGKFKNFVAEEDTNDNVNNTATSVEENKSNLETVKEIEERICDCCNETTITIVSSDIYKIGADGEKVRILTHPTINALKGNIYEGVAICDGCLSQCPEDVHKQYAWFAGKINSLHNEIKEKQSDVEANNKLIEDIKTKAEKEIATLMEKSRVIESDIFKVENEIESFVQEQVRLESQL